MAGPVPAVRVLRFPAVPPVVTWSLVTAGAWLIYASVRGVSPLDELRATLTGAGPVPRSMAEAAADHGPATASPADHSTTSTPAGSTPALVAIGQGSHRLAPSAAAGFAAWRRVFGRDIPITDSYRPYSVQEQRHREEPGRFSPPDKSAHPKGLAVDVDLGALGADPGTAAGRPVFDRLLAAAQSTGWCNPRGPYRGDHKEPWHFSFGGCA